MTLAPFRRRKVQLLACCAALVAIAAAGLLAYTLTGDDSAGASVRKLRWYNVELSLPEDPDVWVTWGFFNDFPDSGGFPVVRIRPSPLADAVIINAQTGAVVSEQRQPQDRATVDAVLATLQIVSWDRQSAPWPYNSGPPDVPRERLGNLTFIRPDPASGILVEGVLDETPQGPVLGLQFFNQHSAVSMNTETGAIYPETTLVLPEDQQAFDRYLATIELVEDGQ